MAFFCADKLYGSDAEEKCDLLKKKLLYRRHLLHNYKWLKSDEKTTRRIYYRRAFALPAFRRFDDYPSSKRIGPGITRRRYFIASKPREDTRGKDCWYECQRTEGLCEQFCGGGACCQNRWKMAFVNGKYRG